MSFEPSNRKDLSATCSNFPNHGHGIGNPPVALSVIGSQPNDRNEDSTTKAEPVETTNVPMTEDTLALSFLA
jgi:hypothetical protein